MIQLAPLPLSHGFSFLFTVIDRFTRWPEAVPLKSAMASKCADALLLYWVARFGVPQHMTSDRGPQFTSAVWSHLASSLSVTLHHTTAYHRKVMVRWRDSTNHLRHPSAVICHPNHSWTTYPAFCSACARLLIRISSAHPLTYCCASPSLSPVNCSRAGFLPSQLPCQLRTTLPRTPRTPPAANSPPRTMFMSAWMRRVLHCSPLTADHSTCYEGLTSHLNYLFLIAHNGFQWIG